MTPVASTQETPVMDTTAVIPVAGVVMVIMELPPEHTTCDTDEQYAVAYPAPAAGFEAAIR